MLAGEPWVRCPPWSRRMARTVSPGLEQGLVDGQVGGGPGVGLHVGVLGAEQGLGPLAGQVLDLVDDLVPAVVPAARIALGVLVGEHRAGGGQDGRRGEVLRGDQLQGGRLALDSPRRAARATSGSASSQAPKGETVAHRGTAPPWARRGAARDRGRLDHGAECTRGPGRRARGPRIRSGADGPRSEHPGPGRRGPGHVPPRRDTRDPPRAARPHGPGSRARPSATPVARCPTACSARWSSVRVVRCLQWHVPDPGALVADRLGIAPRQSRASRAIGGNTPQALHGRRGRGRPAWRARRLRSSSAPSAVPPGREPAGPAVADLDHPGRRHAAGPALRRSTGPPRPSIEAAVGLVLPVHVYPLLENALRMAAGWTLAEHRARIGSLWSRFSQVAASNPYAWIRTPGAARTIVTARPDEPDGGLPLPQAVHRQQPGRPGGRLRLLLAPRWPARPGIERDRWVFPLAAAEANDHWFLSERPELSRSPGHQAGRARRRCSWPGRHRRRRGSPICTRASRVWSRSPRRAGLPSRRRHRAAHPDRRADLRRRPGNNYASHGIASIGPSAAAPTGSGRDGDGARVVRHQARRWPLLHRAAPATASDPRTCSRRRPAGEVGRGASTRPATPPSRPSPSLRPRRPPERGIVSCAPRRPAFLGERHRPRGARRADHAEQSGLVRHPRSGRDLRTRRLTVNRRGGHPHPGRSSNPGCGPPPTDGPRGR